MLVLTKTGLDQPVGFGGLVNQFASAWYVDEAGGGRRPDGGG